MLQRFGLIVWPDIAGEWNNVDRTPDYDALRVAHQTFDYLDTLDYRALGARRDTDHDGDEVGLPYLRLAPDALEVFNDWRQPLEHELRAGALHPALESHFAKYRKLVPALALLLHLADHNEGAVGVEAMMTAIAWDAYLRTHARRVYAAATNADARGRACNRQAYPQGRSDGRVFEPRRLASRLGAAVRPRPGRRRARPTG